MQTTTLNILKTRNNLPIKTILTL